MSQRHSITNPKPSKWEGPLIITIAVLWMPALYAIAQVLDYLESVNWL
jgi:hypothetical protein